MLESGAIVESRDVSFREKIKAKPFLQAVRGGLSIDSHSSLTHDPAYIEDDALIEDDAHSEEIEEEWRPPPPAPSFSRAAVSSQPTSNTEGVPQPKGNERKVTLAPAKPTVTPAAKRRPRRPRPEGPTRKSRRLNGPRLEFTKDIQWDANWPIPWCSSPLLCQ